MAELDFASCRKDVAVVHIGHHDDELEVAVVKFFKGFLLRSHLGEAWRIAETEGGIFIEYLLINATVVFKHESVILRSEEQDVVNALIHQLGERCVAQDECFEIGYAAHDQSIITVSSSFRASDLGKIASGLRRPSSSNSP